MGETKRWTVTYTKHVRQKRKVFQDGVLELYGSSNKISLYDDSEKLIGTRFLKKDELVECGGMLNFENHLVDIGDLDGTCKAQIDLKVNGKDKKSNEKAAICRQNFRPDSSPVNKRNESGRCKGTDSYPEVTRSTGKGNKKTESRNSGRPQSPPNSAQTALKEWNALYTTQITQKAKRYHDGILRLAVCGSHMSQVILLNEDGAVLSSKYLKSAECVRTGSTYELPNYLVEICELRTLQGVNKKSEFDSRGRDGHPNAKRGTVRDCSRTSEKKGIELQNSGRPQNHLNSSTVREWSALYTTQMTQKAKRYHDGIVRFSDCGSHMNQVILLNEDGTVLCSKYLKSIEHVRTGSTYEMSNYLVEICEPRTLQGEALTKDPSPKKVGTDSSLTDKLSNDADVLRNKPFHDGAEEFTKDLSSNKVGVTSSSKAKLISSADVLRNEPFRDPFQIISILKKPSSEESLVSRDSVVEHIHPSQSSELLPSDVQGIKILVDPGHCGKPQSDKISASSSSMGFGDNSMQTTKSVKGKYPSQAHTDNNTKAEKEEFFKGLSSDASSLSCDVESAVTSTKNESNEEFNILSEKTMDADEFPTFDLGI